MEKFEIHFRRIELTSHLKSDLVVGVVYPGQRQCPALGPAVVIARNVGRFSATRIGTDKSDASFPILHAVGERFPLFIEWNDMETMVVEIGADVIFPGNSPETV